MFLYFNVSLYFQKFNIQTFCLAHFSSYSNQIYMNIIRNMLHTIDISLKCYVGTRCDVLSYFSLLSFSSFSYNFFLLNLLLLHNAHTLQSDRHFKILYSYLNLIMGKVTQSILFIFQNI